ncbi:DedA family protein [Haloarcula sp. S1CR25-12]|uniref:DedA family protein n=1 Tax=Haloarcula saliterrae TaxID=2950534 RepID=A0ABU2FDD4_9EURY|nr:DedA family protein [Haloarcula sp. S1CR25-12]MDS0260269.1 DedA family protein [Haloarcula sp. S1CR25-12]
MVDLTAVVLDYLRLYGPLVLCLFTFFETSMLFPFLPSEVVVPAAAAILVTDLPSLLVFVTAAGVGGTVGAFVPFYVFYDTRAGRADWLRRYVDVPDAKLRHGQRWFQRWGRPSVLWGRFLPVVRSVVSIPAGLARMNPFEFGLLTAVGTVAFYAVAGAVVYYGRTRGVFETAVAVAAERPVLAALALLALLALGVLADRAVDRWVTRD